MGMNVPFENLILKLFHSIRNFIYFLLITHHSLDIDIQIEGNNFSTKIYHKVDDFDFEVVSFPFPNSNISDRITYNSFYSQLIRYASICSKFNYFAARSKRLADCLIRRGYKKHRFRMIFVKFLANYCDVVKLKYDIDTMKRFINTEFRL